MVQYKPITELSDDLDFLRKGASFSEYDTNQRRNIISSYRLAFAFHSRSKLAESTDRVAVYRAYAYLIYIPAMWSYMFTDIGVSGCFEVVAIKNALRLIMTIGREFKTNDDVLNDVLSYMRLDLSLKLCKHHIDHGGNDVTVGCENIDSGVIYTIARTIFEERFYTLPDDSLFRRENVQY